MSGRPELQTWHDLAYLLCNASHREEAKDDMAISVYSCHDERSLVNTNHQQITLLNMLLCNAEPSKYAFIASTSWSGMPVEYNEDQYSSSITTTVSTIF